MRINEFGTFGICLDVHSEDRFEGRMYVPVYEKERLFKSLHGLIAEMNRALESVGIPHPFFEYRSFSGGTPKKEAGQKKEEVRKKHFDHGNYSGKAATFLVNVLYRQNATWQGTVTWVEGGRSENFRSALELFVLIESVL
ncbi:MAG: hypothetical protein K6F44_07550 [Lachnospiraceae bacterium]|nr:hypothetical protein [Lachnospiraceae bacterium]